MSSYEERLAAMDDVFTNAPAEPAGGMPDDGWYQAIVERFSPEERRSDNVLQLVTELRIVHDAKWDGKVVRTRHQLEPVKSHNGGIDWEATKQRMSALKKHLLTIGLDVNGMKLSELLEALHPLLDTPVGIAVKTSSKLDSEGRPFRNVYVNERLGDPIKVAAPAAAAAAPEPVPAAALASDPDDIPF